MSVHRTYQDDISKIMSLTTIPKENWNEAWRNLAQDTAKWKKLTKKWLVKQRQKEKTRYEANKQRLHLEENHFTEQKNNEETNNAPRRRISRLMRPNELNVLIADRSS